MGTVVHLTDQSLQLSSDNWNSTYTTVCSLSTLWEESGDIIPTVVNYLSTTENIVVSSMQVTDLRVLSSLFVEGTATFLQTETITVTDPIIYIAQDNQSDILDVGLAAAWTNPPGYPAGYQYGGLVRRADNKFWTLFSGITALPLSGINLNWTLSSVKLEPLSANFYGDIYGNRSVFGSLSITNGLTINGNVSGNNLKTSFNQGSAIGNYSFAVNSGKAIGNYSLAEGHDTEAKGIFSHAEGISTVASGSASHAEGNKTVATGNYSHTEGYAVSATNNYTHSEGYLSIAAGIAGHAEGITTFASASASHAEGKETIATQPYTHAEGLATSATGQSSHAEGENTTASGNASHSEGINTIALGPASHAEGENTAAEGAYSHAEGGFTKTTGTYAHAEGYYTQARNLGSHAAGHKAAAIHNYSYIWSGDSTLTNTISTTRTGQYMVSAPGGVYIPGKVGIGTNSLENALTVVGIISTVGGNSDQWNTAFNTVCAIVGSDSEQWDLAYSTVYNLSGQWDTTYKTVCALSASWEESADILPTVTNYLSTNSSTLCSIDVRGKILSAGTDLFNIFLTEDSDSQTLTYIPSSYELIISNGNTVNLSSINSTIASNSAFWQSTYETVSALSASWEESADIIPTVTNYLSTNTIVVSTLDTKEHILSGGKNLLDIFLTTAPAFQTLTYTPSSYELKISGGNTVSLSSINSTFIANSAYWQSTYELVSTLSASWEESADIIPTVTNYLSTNNVLISSLQVTNNITAANISAAGGLFGRAQDSVLSLTSTNTVQNSTVAVAISSINIGLQLLVPAPTYTPPVATLTNFSPNTFEVGETVSRNLTLGFTQNNAGAPTQFEIFKNSISQQSQTLPFTYIVNETAVAGSTTYRNTVTYGDGLIKNNILGLPDSRGQILSGTISINQTYNGYFRRWVGSVPTFPSTASDIRTLSLTSSFDVNPTANLASPTPIYIANKFILIVLPDVLIGGLLRKPTTVITEANENITTLLNVSSVQIPDAGGINRDYKLYYYETALPLNATLTNITLGT